MDINRLSIDDVYKAWIWIGPPLMVISLAALVYLIVGLVGTIRKAFLFRIGLAEKQEVQFSEAGRVILSSEGPRFSRRFASIRFEVRGVNGDPVPARRVVFRAQTSGISTVRTEEMVLDVPRPGRYIVTMTGGGAAGENDAKHAVVFMKPHLMQTLTFIVGLIVASGVLICSLVFFVLRLNGSPDA